MDLKVDTSVFHMASFWTQIMRKEIICFQMIGLLIGHTSVLVNGLFYGHDVFILIWTTEWTHSAFLFLD